MNVGIIGSGNIGSTLARNLKALGNTVLIANSRGPSTLAEFAAETGVVAATVEQAAQARDLVIIAIPQLAVSNLPLDVLRANAAVVVDAGNYYPTRDGVVAEVEAGATDSEWIASVLGRPVIKAFNNIVANSLATRDALSGTAERVALSVAGDDVNAKKLVESVVEQLGFDAVDGGTLAESWRQQPGTPAYCKDLNAAQLKAALASADHAEIKRYRKEADEAAAPYLKPFKG
ncbi:MAG: oxidoreductase [Polaromonas sp.]|jgi:predicted dinucleotide-binding enzyme|nr:oxidoreductase [Polaromonas sp.]MDB5845248.1 oxidoreductase [Polaromonas sp.]MDB5940235.1 oxidoreductase [Polaromonas sp.]